MSYFLNDPDVYKAAIIIIGNEILSGRTQDTNTMWIAENLIRRGIVIIEVRIIPDIEEKIIEAVNALRPHVDYVFTTGGIGPTHDDITAASIAKALDLELEVNAEAMKLLERYYGKKELTPARAKMAQMPKGAELIPNSVSGAPGFIIGNVHVMAGVPRIMQAMMNYMLDNRLKTGKSVMSNMISCSLLESEISEALEELQTRYKEVEIGSYPHFRGGAMGLNLVLRSTDGARLKEASEELIEIIARLGGDTSAVGLQTPIDFH